MLAEVRPDGLTAIDTFRLALAGDLFATRDGAEIRVAHGDGIGAQLLRAQLTDDGALRLVAYNHRAAPADQRRALLAALAAAFADGDGRASVRLDTAAWPAAALDALRASGVLADGGLCLRDGWAQQADLWLVDARPPCATLYTLTRGLRHPRRPPAPRGDIYARDLPALGVRFTLRGWQPTEDAARLARWFDEPRVRAGWPGAPVGAMPGADPHVTPLIGCFDGEPFAYFEAYWLKEDALSPHVAPRDHDRGLRMLVGAPRWRGPQRVAGWLPSVVHYLFLDDPRTEAVGCAVPAGHARLADHLARHGFARQRRLPQADAQPLWMHTLREAFFAGRHV
ncbi:ornibactin biosynthesis protein [Burkholderia stagnalis]|uniref:GNAT family N-acetyltransferase n=1 Tax=Burkholderia stagnalis TaxID=1503054 RepID=UPI00075B8D6D|nr:GNAT family N-acetyltransferase [Burkholderia stagnalis]AOK54362.1 ornibactin biosynthesis protein [Burkholderia stagnalis]KVN08134.1 ornibactin biosynthesis protein [Burkholderia stagnalis]KVN73960.1 ornibactin biosynthesis protein [Burkholderia stagnalis]KWO27212.1 ornibactin biosynthesis protein [Burkholderia stagnalis]KWO45132.1 ornibactin biosynthesis protein [Burkholderia stagnalis]